MFEIVKVENKKTARMFLDVAHVIYRDDPNWICPLDDIIEGIFNPEKNKYFENGDAYRWILRDENNKLIGRIAAFYNKDKALKYDPPAGGVGFFDCIHSQEAADLLFDTAKTWLELHGMGAMDGPINFGENDNYWGLLVEGFTPPAFGMNYNPPYYKDLFESYGFRSFFEQESKHLDITKPFPDRFWKIAKWVMSRNSYRFEHFRKSQLKKYAADIVQIYNEAWVQHEHFSPLTLEKVLKGFNEAKPFIIEDFIWFAYQGDTPVGFLVMLPDMNQLFKLFNGKLTLWNKIRFLLMKRSKRINRSRITILGVTPKHQGKGVESAIFWHLQDPLIKRRPHYNEIEISWVGDFNSKMQATLEAMGANPGKIHVTYRKLFDEKKGFKKASKIV
ncbi:MAG: hypothetical protein K9G76_01975 [Bacteroidales bacterium]|nr:hypothetical protein [Bacteroidales bacterium]MCF8403322.1 hypothetical protein [Bacteroidales bacterium]